jgi:phenylpyruvate tautomerase PptA (4-oxalocrotonate tautomerase family)
MPLVQATVRGEPSAQLTAEIVAALTACTVQTLRKDHARTTVFVQYVPASQWVRGGKPAAGFLVEARVTAGQQTPADRAAFIDAANDALQAMVGAPGYVVVNEIDGRAWGYAGETLASRYAEVH